MGNTSQKTKSCWKIERAHVQTHPFAPPIPAGTHLSVHDLTGQSVTSPDSTRGHPVHSTPSPFCQPSPPSLLTRAVLSPGASFLQLEKREEQVAQKPKTLNGSDGKGGGEGRIAYTAHCCTCHPYYAAPLWLHCCIAHLTPLLYFNF